MREAFLINPPRKKRISRWTGKLKGKHVKLPWSLEKAKKHIGAEGTKHRPVVYSHGGHWTTSDLSRIAAPGRHVNPFKVSRRRRRNPGANLLLMGLNPKKGHSMRKHRRRRNPARRRNPVAKLTNMVPALVAGGVGIFAINKGTQMLGIAPGSIMDYGAKVAILMGGGWAVDKYISSEASKGFVIAGGATVAWTLIMKLLQGAAPGVAAMAGLGNDQELLAAYPDYQEASYAAFPDVSGYGVEPGVYGSY